VPQKCLSGSFDVHDALGQAMSLLKYRDITHPIKEDPIKEDVKKKDFSPPLGEMRVW
jgi:hypothetical protein